MKKLMSVLSIFLVFALLAGAISASAAEYSNAGERQHSFNKLSEVAAMANEVADTERINEIEGIVKNYIANGNAVLHFESAYLNYNEAKVLDIAYENDIYTSITIPVAGSAYSLLSNVTFVLENDQIAIYSETLITRSAENKFVIATYYDGVLVDTNHTDIGYISNEEIQKDLDTIHTSVQKGKAYAQTRGTGAIVGCLTGVLGVNAAVAYLIAGTCIASCPTVVPICVACIGAVATIGAADIAAVVACFNL